MSGFEIAGIVLGSIPLLISALEHYREGISTIRKWRHYDRELRSLIWNLETERVRFQDVCEKLLVGIVSASQIEIMVDDPFGPAWQENIVRSKIRARLWRSDDVFDYLMKDMEEAIKEMMRRFDLDTVRKMQNDSFIMREFKRASFAIKRSDHAQQISTIKESITSLESLIDRNINMEPGRKLRSQGRLMRLVRETSCSVYRALRSSFESNSTHNVHLGLESRSAELNHKDDDEETIQRLTFQVSLNCGFETTSRGRGRISEQVSWEEIVVQALPSLAPPSSQRPLDGMGRKSVKFAASQSSGNSSTSMATHVEQTSNITQLSCRKMSGRIGVPGPQSINMCQRICHGHKQVVPDCYGKITDWSPQIPREFGIYPGQSPDIDQWLIVSLREVLEHPDAYPHMPYTSRLQLAAMIASSFLQLHQTPWLPDILSSRDILFLQRGTEIQYEHAFIMKSFPERVRVAPRDGGGGGGIDDSGSLSGCCPPLLSLGILLLELNLGSTIDHHRTDSEKTSSSKPGLMYDFMTAQRLLQQKQIGSLNYTSAVQRCIWGEFTRPKLDLTDEDFRQEIYEKVVALLETDLGNAIWSYDTSSR